MKPSLEEERRALLAQIEASRAVYRRLLTGTAAPEPANPQVALSSSARTEHIDVFPRSRTVQWVMAHPVTVAAGVALLVWAAPRMWEYRQQRKTLKATSPHQAHKHQRRVHDEFNDASRYAHHTAGEGNMRALIAAAALLLRNPATMRNLTQIAGTAWQWLQQRRGSSSRTAR